MAYTNNGDYRYQDITITKTVDGSVVTGYPTTYRITAASDDGTTYQYLSANVTETQLAQMLTGDAVTSGTYLHLLEDFKAWVEAKESALDIDAVETNSAYGTSASWCPLS